MLSVITLFVGFDMARTVQNRPKIKRYWADIHPKWDRFVLNKSRLNLMIDICKKITTLKIFYLYI